MANAAEEKQDLCERKKRGFRKRKGTDHRGGGNCFKEAKGGNHDSPPDLAFREKKRKKKLTGIRHRREKSKKSKAAKEEKGERKRDEP